MVQGKQNARVLVVDDSPATLEVVGRFLGECGHRVETAPDVPSAVERLQGLPVDLVITDFRMPGPDGLDLVRHVRENLPQTAVIMLTGFPSIEGAVEAVKGGAEAYLTKPFTKIELLDTVARVLNKEQRRNDSGELGLPVVLTGRSEEARRLQREVHTLGPGRSPILIRAPFGSGGLEFSRALHDCSDRKDGPFATAHCELLGSSAAAALFGTTESGDSIVGRSEGGTLVIDCVGMLGEVAQLHLFRLLQERRRIPIGGERIRTADVRIIAIARRNIAALAGGGIFRRDLLDRLSAARISLPPPNERKEDIVDQVRNIAVREAALWNVKPPDFSDRALEAIAAYHWHGGLEELTHVVRQLLPALASKSVDAADLPPRFRFQAVTPTDLLLSLREVEESHIRTVLERVNGNKTAAAKILGIDRKTLRSKIGI